MLKPIIERMKTFLSFYERHTTTEGKMLVSEQFMLRELPELIHDLEQLEMEEMTHDERSTSRKA